MKRFLAAVSVIAMGASVPTAVRVSYDVVFETTGPWENKGCSAVGGSDSLIGTITGNEPIPLNRSNDYHGKALKRVTKVEYCSMRTLPSGQGADCLISIAGSGYFDVVLEVEPGAVGGYLKVKKAPGPMVSTVSGSCDPAEMVQLQLDYAKGETAGSPHGQPIAIDVRDSLRVSKWVGKVQIPYRAKPGEGDWTLLVVRRLP